MAAIATAVRFLWRLIWSSTDDESMATFRLPILNAQSKPEAGGDVRIEPVSQHLANDLYDYLAVVFDDTATRDGIHGKFTVPQNYVNTANLVLRWFTPATTGAVEWDFDYRAIAPGESGDPSTDQESVNAASTADATARDIVNVSIALTDGNFAAGDEVPFTLFRDGTDAGDTLADVAVLIGAYFEYSD